MKLPEKIEKPKVKSPRDLCIVGVPKIGKSSIVAGLTRQKNALVLNLERGGYDYIEARHLSIYEDADSTKDAYDKYIKARNLLLENKGKYDILIIDSVTELDSLSEIGGTYMYMDSLEGKNFNRTEDGKRIEFGEKGWRSVSSKPEGYGYRYSRNWFLQQIEIFREISPYRVYVAHVGDKYIKDDGGTEMVVGKELFLTGKLKLIFASKVTALGKIVAEGNERYINFEALNDSIIAGSRHPGLKGKMLISREENGEIKTFWENIFNF